MRHSSAAPDVISMKLSIPKPTSETLPATAPAMTATKPSRQFHASVMYSRRRPRRTTAARPLSIEFSTLAILSWSNSAWLGWRRSERMLTH